MLTALVLLCTMGTTDCRQIAESPDQSELPFMCLTYGMEETTKHPVPEGKYLRPQERAPDYQLVAAWSAFLIFLGAGAFVIGMAIHNETLAAQHPPHPAPIYYCATGEEIPLYEPCKDRKDQRDV